MARDYKFRCTLKTYKMYVFLMVTLCSYGSSFGYTHLDYLLVSRYQGIVKHHLQTGATEVVTSRPSAAIDYDPVDDYIYFSQVWSDMHDIWRVHSDGTGEEVFLTNVRNCWGLSVDWVHRELYWTDSVRNNDLLEKVNLDGTGRTVLLGSDQLNGPLDIAVDPYRGYMYWTEYYRIKQARLDGTDLTTVVTGLQRPTGMAIYSPCPRRLYWADHDTGLLGVSQMDGANPQTLLTFNAYPQGRVWALTVLDDNIYWADTEAQEVYQADRVTGNNVITLPVEGFVTMDMKAVRIRTFY